MRKVIGIGACFALAAVGHGAASAGVVADYQDDFTYPTPKVGWSYLWNANGAIGTAANYVSLVPDGASPARYQTEAQGAFPDAAPGSSLSATATTLIPGQGTAQNALERYVIVGYTITAADIAAHGNQLVLSEYSFAVSATSTDGITARIYKNDTLFINQPLPPGIVFSSDTPDPNGGPIPLGEFAAGETLYVAIGSEGLALPQVGGNDTNDVLTVDYTISLVPEPTGAAAAVALGALAMRRRRCRRR